MVRMMAPWSKMKKILTPTLGFLLLLVIVAEFIIVCLLLPNRYEKYGSDEISLFLKRKKASQCVSHTLRSILQFCFRFFFSGVKPGDREMVKGKGECDPSAALKRHEATTEYDCLYFCENKEGKFVSF